MTKTIKFMLFCLCQNVSQFIVIRSSTYLYIIIFNIYFYLLTHRQMWVCHESHLPGTLWVMQSPSAVINCFLSTLGDKLPNRGCRMVFFSMMSCCLPSRDDHIIFQSKASCGKSVSSRAALHNKIILHLLLNSTKGSHPYIDDSCEGFSFFNVLF